MIASLVFAGLVGQAPAQTLDLNRHFVKGSKAAYKVRSHLGIETQQYNQPFFLPEELDINYDFTYTVKDVKSEGFASIDYRRPTTTTIEGETAEAAPKEKVDKHPMILDMTVSPINEITTVKDLSPKRPDGESGDGDGVDRQVSILLRPVLAKATSAQALSISQFTGELYRMALFIGSPTSAMDFNPKLPVDDAKVGTTWKRTVSYEPQAVKGAKGKQAVQRIDMVYKYEGEVTVDGVKYQRVSAAAVIDTDAALFINQILGTKPSESGLKALLLKMKTSITFDLDEKTHDTIRAVADAKGDWKLQVVDLKDQDYVDQNVTGHVVMTRSGIS